MAAVQGFLKISRAGGKTRGISFRQAFRQAFSPAAVQAVACVVAGGFQPADHLLKNSAYRQADILREEYFPGRLCFLLPGIQQQKRRKRLMTTSWIN